MPTSDPGSDRFFSLYNHGFVRLGVAVPVVEVANPARNAESTIALAREADKRSVALTLFPELGLSGYSLDDLFQQDAVLDGVKDAIETVLAESRKLNSVLVVGAPLRIEQQLFNCGIAMYRGRLLAITPKSYIPNYREFYEKRQFSSGRAALTREITFLGQTVPFGSDVVVTARSEPNFSFHMEICEDVWVPIPPSTFAAFAGATVLVNLSASNITIGKAGYRKRLSGGQSSKCVAAYLYSAAGPGESTTDLAWDGDALIYENGRLLAEGERFTAEAKIVTADVDLDGLVADRMRLTSFADNATEYRDRIEAFRRVEFDYELPRQTVTLERSFPRFPYVPSERADRDARCYEAYNIQVNGLVTRLRATGIKRVVIGVSGGLDSTHALIVCARAMDLLGLPRSHIFAYTMPGFATSDKTKSNAHALMQALGTHAEEIDIRPACLQVLKDIGHPYADGEELYDITFENVQAGQRTAHLFRLANYLNGLVIGTGDLSEVALGWSTYGVGDQMSHYGVNSSVPKTLIQYLIRWIVDSDQFSDQTSEILDSILKTEISPELVPASDKDGRPTQSSEAKVGPYELQDFHLYWLSRYGFRPSKVAFLSHHAWHESYDLATIKRWLGVFLVRFFQTSQFKRSALPNGPKVGSGGSLSPRGDWRAPSDSRADVWLAELDEGVPDL